jgi:hypothetical protein
MNKLVFLACPLSGIILLQFIALSRRNCVQIVLATKRIQKLQHVLSIIREVQKLPSSNI